MFEVNFYFQKGIHVPNWYLWVQYPKNSHLWEFEVLKKALNLKEIWC